MYIFAGKSLGTIMHQQTFDGNISIQCDNTDYSLRLSVLTRASTKESSANNTFQRSSTERVRSSNIRVSSLDSYTDSNGKATAELLDRVSISENSIVKEIASRKIRRGGGGRERRYVIANRRNNLLLFERSNNSRFDICVRVRVYVCFRQVSNISFNVCWPYPSILLIITRYVFTIRWKRWALIKSRQVDIRSNDRRKRAHLRIVKQERWEAGILDPASYAANYSSSIHLSRFLKHCRVIARLFKGDIFLRSRMAESPFRLLFMRPQLEKHRTMTWRRHRIFLSTITRPCNRTRLRVES